jgi:hypothetical protein
MSSGNTKVAAPITEITIPASAPVGGTSDSSPENPHRAPSTAKIRG